VPETTSASGSSSPEQPAQHGFYFRVSLGVGMLTGDAELPFDEGMFSGSTEGVAVLGELAFGGTLMPGLVVGGGTWSAIVPDASIDLEEGAGHTAWGSYGMGSVQSVVLGPFADWFPLPNLGLDAQLGMGLGLTSMSKGDETIANCDASDSCTYHSIPPEGVDEFGFGLMFGAGYEFNLSPKWSVGGLLRATWVTSDKLSPLVPGILINSTYY
jgi:hypothetical protein